MKDKRELLIQYMEGELEPSEERELERRLAAEDELKEELDLLKRSVELMEQHSDHNPGSQYWSSFYSRLKPKLQDKSPMQRFLDWAAPKQGLKLAGAIGTLAVVFIVTGILLSQLIIPQVSLPAVKKTVIKIKRTEGYLQNIAHEHLEHSRLLFQDLVNISTGEDIYFEKLESSRELGQKLLSDNRTYRLAANRQNNSELEKRLDQLELLLLEIANLQPESAEFVLPSLKRRIVKNNLLIEIEITQLQDMKTSAGKEVT